MGHSSIGETTEIIFSRWNKKQHVSNDPFHRCDYTRARAAQHAYSWSPTTGFRNPLPFGRDPERNWKLRRSALVRFRQLRHRKEPRRLPRRPRPEPLGRRALCTNMRGCLTASARWRTAQTATTTRATRMAAMAAMASKNPTVHHYYVLVGCVVVDVLHNQFVCEVIHPNGYVVANVDGGISLCRRRNVGRLSNKADHKRTERNNSKDAGNRIPLRE